MNTAIDELKFRLREIDDIDTALSVLNWDQSTYMPPGGAPGRGQQMATLARLSQEKFTDPAIGRLLDELQPYQESLPYDSDEASLLRETRRQYERAIKIPPDFLSAYFRHTSESYQVWASARPESNFKKVQPYLEKTLDYSRQLANFFPGYEHIADPLIDRADYGMKASTIRQVFADLRKGLVPIVQEITSQPAPDDSFLHRDFDEEQQIQFGRRVVGQLGYDFQRGRVDKTHHPFETRFNSGDVRITTRTKRDELTECLFSMIHESGHGMYEQGVNPQYDGTPLAGGASAGVHESQSRLWENIVGRSRGFWTYFYPQLLEAFPQLKDVPLDDFYCAINKVERTLIRTEADEVTYNLHVMLRFDLGLALLEGRLKVQDLPAAWNERYQSDLGIKPEEDKNGVLQDVHWFGGLIGGSFQGYTLGNILGALFYSSALKAHPEIQSEIEQGKFGTLLGWLTENIYQYGRKYTPTELIERATGGPISIEPYMSYLKQKYGELYKIGE